MASLGLLAGGAGALLFALDQSVKASGTEVHPQAMPWNHKGIISSLDHARYACLESRTFPFTIVRCFFLKIYLEAFGERRWKS